MTISEIANRPRIVTEIPVGSKGVHESILRAFSIVEKVKYLLENDVPGKIILELIEEMEVL